MKRLLVCLLIAAMVMMTFVACDGNNGAVSDTSDSEEKQNTGNASDSSNVQDSTDATSDTAQTSDTSETTDTSGTLETEPTGVTTSSIGLQYLLNDDKQSYTVVGIGTCTESEIIIDKYNGLPVTIIGLEAFRLCPTLTSVTMGEGVLRICDYAFAYCDNLESVTIPASVTEIGKGILNYCEKMDAVDYKGAMEQWNAISFDGNPIYSAGLTVNFGGSCPHNVWDENNTCLDCGTTCDHDGGTEEWLTNSATHTKVRSCCGQVLEAPEVHGVYQGECLICGYKE